MHIVVEIVKPSSNWCKSTQWDLLNTTSYKPHLPISTISGTMEKTDVLEVWGKIALFYQPPTDKSTLQKYT